MITIGLIIDKYHLEKKVADLISYLQKKVRLNIYVEEEYLLDFAKQNFDEDLFFVKAKGDLVVNFVKLIERDTDIPVINSSNSIWLCYDRFLNSIILRKAGINVPDFSLNPVESKAPFSEYIVKNIKDQKNYAFNPIIEEQDEVFKVIDQRALSEAKEGNFPYGYLYYQKFIRSKWEYKVYCIGDTFFYFKQVPLLFNPNKMESRRRIKHNKTLREMSCKAIQTMGLKIASLDFLKTENGEFFLTDINSSPNFNYIKNGAQIVGDYLISSAKI